MSGVAADAMDEIVGQTRSKASELLNRLHVEASKFPTNWTYWKCNSKKSLCPDFSKLLVMGSNHAKGAQNKGEKYRFPNIGGTFDSK